MLWAGSLNIIGNLNNLKYLRFSNLRAYYRDCAVAVEHGFFERLAHQIPLIWPCLCAVNLYNLIPLGGFKSEVVESIIQFVQFRTNALKQLTTSVEQDQLHQRLSVVNVGYEGAPGYL